MQDVLITGGDGMVGSYIDFGTRLSHAELDVTDLVAVTKAVTTYKPRTIIHLAATTDLVRSEQDPPYAYAVNAIGTYHVALASRAIGAKLVYVSTSGVFDGTKSEPYTEEDTPNPINVYGHSKYLGELAVHGILTNFLIVRTAWIFGGGRERDKKFVGKLIGQLGGAEVKAVTDKLGSPTYTKDLVAGIRRLLDEDATGIYHMGNAGTASRFDIAREIVSCMGAKTRVVPALSSDFPLAYTSGANESMASKVSYMRPWQAALKEYIGAEWR